MKKYFVTCFVLAFFSFAFSASDDSEKAKELIGDYEVKDSNGTIWYFKLSDENKVTVKTKNMSDEDMFYGTWYAMSDEDKVCIFSFIDFYAGNPPIEFPDGQVGTSETMSISKEWFLYHDWQHRESKNPNTRLKVTKK